MSVKARFALGLGLGVVLSVGAVVLIGAGDGTYAGLVANVSLLMFIPAIGGVLAILGAPFLWAFYFAAIPAIRSRAYRVVAIILVSLFHLVPGVWSAVDDSAFARAMKFHTPAAVFYGATLAGTLLCLVYLGSLGSRRRVESPAEAK